jgi:ABC-type polysaccharide/polyol phosphate transport system ATPase subunit
LEVYNKQIKRRDIILMSEKEEEYKIIVEDVYKTFNVYLDRANTIKEKLLFLFSRNKKEKREVLKGINLKIKQGEVVALIGTNGSGKSTLLKLMTKIIYPNKGKITTNRKINISTRVRCWIPSRLFWKRKYIF